MGYLGIHALLYHRHSNGGNVMGAIITDDMESNGFGDKRPMHDERLGTGFYTFVADEVPEILYIAEGMLHHIGVDINTHEDMDYDSLYIEILEYLRRVKNREISEADRAFMKGPACEKRAIGLANGTPDGKVPGMAHVMYEFFLDDIAYMMAWKARMDIDDVIRRSSEQTLAEKHVDIIVEAIVSFYGQVFPEINSAEIRRLIENAPRPPDYKNDLYWMMGIKELGLSLGGFEHYEKRIEDIEEKSASFMNELDL